MMTDTYTKMCLTVIAVSLVVIGFRGFPMVDSAYAQGDKIHKIAICDPSSKRCVGVSSSGFLKTIFP